MSTNPITNIPAYNFAFYIDADMGQGFDKVTDKVTHNIGTGVTTAMPGSYNAPATTFTPPPVPLNTQAGRGTTGYKTNTLDGNKDGKADEGAFISIMANNQVSSFYVTPTTDARLGKHDINGDDAPELLVNPNNINNNPNANLLIAQYRLMYGVDALPEGQHLLIYAGRYMQ